MRDKKLQWHIAFIVGEQLIPHRDISGNMVDNVILNIIKHTFFKSKYKAGNKGGNAHRNTGNNGTPPVTAQVPSCHR